MNVNVLNRKDIPVVTSTHQFETLAIPTVNIIFIVSTMVSSTVCTIGIVYLVLIEIYNAYE